MDKLIRKYKIRLGSLLNCLYEQRNEIENKTRIRIDIKIKMLREIIEDLENLKETGESNE